MKYCVIMYSQYDLLVTERSINGSSRVGTENPEGLIVAQTGISLLQECSYRLNIGDKRYEMSNHLGNVLQVVSDRKLQMETTEGSGVLDYYVADVVSQSDYFPFGMLLPNTNVDPVTGDVLAITDNDYRYSFQGQEKDDEIKGEGNSINYKYRMHDPRVGRFFAVDPVELKYPANSPYVFSQNIVIHAIEMEGAEAFFIHGTTNTSLEETGVIPVPEPERTTSVDLNAYKFRNNTLVTNEVSDIFGNSTTDVGFSWSGDNNTSARKKAAQELAIYIHQNRQPGEPITIVGHSHGGNVGILAANYLVQMGLEDAGNINIVVLNTPDDNDINIGPDGIDLYSVSAFGDMVQGGFGDNFWLGDEVDNADSYIYYDDQLDGGVGFVGHVGPADKNVKVWAPKLRSVVESKNEDWDKVAGELKEFVDKIKTQ